MNRYSKPWPVWRSIFLSSALVNSGLGVCLGRTTAPKPAIAVCLDSAGPASKREVIDMERSATAIFNKAGITVLWPDCCRASAPCHASDRPIALGQSLIRLRIVDHSEPCGAHTLGWMVPGSPVASVRYELARQLSRAVFPFGVLPGLILGHVAAHEIGHILLDSTAHAYFGLMKARYSREDILRMEQGDLLFSDEEAQALCSRLSYKAGKGKLYAASSPSVSTTTLRH